MLPCQPDPVFSFWFVGCRVSRICEKGGYRVCFRVDEKCRAGEA